MRDGVMADGNVLGFRELHFHLLQIHCGGSLLGWKEELRVSVFVLGWSGVGDGIYVLQVLYIAQWRAGR